MISWLELFQNDIYSNTSSLPQPFFFKTIDTPTEKVFDSISYKNIYS